MSLPREWAKRNNIQKGQEIDVQEDGKSVVITANSVPVTETASLDLDGLGTVIPRCVSALYKRGVDTLRLNYGNPELLSIVHHALAKDTVGFEILEQSENSCTIKHVAGDPQEFDSVLRRVFLLLNTMSDESVAAFEKKNYFTLGNLAFLEETNNRFTTSCMRYLNTKGVPNEHKKVGPLYHIVENLEQLADQYKYLFQHFSKLTNGKITLRKEVIDIFKDANKLVRMYSQMFYKFDNTKIVEFKRTRNDIVIKMHKLLKNKVNYAENLLIYHSIAIAQKSFEMVDALLVLKL